MPLSILLLPTLYWWCANTHRRPIINNTKRREREKKIDERILLAIIVSYIFSNADKLHHLINYPLPHLSKFEFRFMNSSIVLHYLCTLKSLECSMKQNYTIHTHIYKAREYRRWRKKKLEELLPQFPHHLAWHNWKSFMSIRRITFMIYRIWSKI